MPDMQGVFRRKPKDLVREPGKSLWEDTKDLIERKQITPIISSFAAMSLFGGKTITTNFQEWADTRLPLLDDERRDLARVAQVLSIQQNDQRKTKRDYLQFLKDILYDKALRDPELEVQKHDDLRSGIMDIDDMSVSKFARELGYPRVPDPNQDTLRLLAELPLPLYITTCYHDFIEQALLRTGKKKQPESEILYWNDALENSESIYRREPDYEPDEQRPLVYHLFGRDVYPESLILTEDDYLDWLVRLAEMRGEVSIATDQANQRIPRIVRDALSKNALLVLGFEAHSMDFRVLFRSLVLGIGANRKVNPSVPRGICMQIDPTAKTPEEQRLARDYVEKYFEQTSQFRVFWGDEIKCIQALTDLWKARTR